MTPLEKLQEIAMASVPEFAGNVLTGFGKIPEEFLEENTTKLPACYISWEGFDRDNRYENGKPTSGGFTEICKMYIRVEKKSTLDIRQIVQRIRQYVNTETTTFDEGGERRDIRFNGGFAERDDNRGDRFTINVIIF